MKNVCAAMTPKTAHAVCALSLVTEVVEDAGLTQPDLEDSTSLGEGDQRRQPEQKARDGEELGRVFPASPFNTPTIITVGR